MISIQYTLRMVELYRVNNNNINGKRANMSALLMIITGPVML